MDIDRISSLTLRLFTGGAFIALALAVADRCMNSIGRDLILGTAPSQVLNWAVVLLAFCTVLLLRQIREALQKS